MIRQKFLLTIFILFVGINSFPKGNANAPILLLATNTDFGSYTGEILKTEGFHEFETDSLSGISVNFEYLRNFDVVILGKTSVTLAQKEMLSEYVKAGGNLIAFMPDSQLNQLFGIKDAKGTFSDGYVAVDSNSEFGVGISSQKMQIHGMAGKYSTDQGKIIATIFVGKDEKNGLPGVVTNTYGKGHSVAFLYNLPQSIVYTRQGNPMSAGIEKDGITGLRGMDLFTDGWIDITKNTLNQADQQMALLTNCIQNLSGSIKPLPRFWYFPDTLKSLVVLDNDGEDNKEADFEQQLNDIDEKGAKMTIYIKDVEKISKEWAEKWTAKGFEISGHPDDTREAGNPHWNTMDSALAVQNRKIESKFGVKVRTNVNHWFVWCGRDENGNQDFAAQARLEEKNGIEMDANYAFYDMNSNQPEHYLGSLGTKQGNFTGSGLIMKYAGPQGNTINVYQRYNAVYDQQYNESHDPEGFFNSFKGLMDRSLNEDIYSVISIKSHNNEYYFSKEPLMKMLDYANAKEVPVWTALKLLDFLKMKDEASFSNVSWSVNKLRFMLNSSVKNENGLSFMLPARHGNIKISKLIVNGENRPFDLKLVKGIEYAFLTITPGNDYEISASYK
jgi:hypothetical protein